MQDVQNSHILRRRLKEYADSQTLNTTGLLDQQKTKDEATQKLIGRLREAELVKKDERLSALREEQMENDVNARIAMDDVLRKKGYVPYDIEVRRRLKVKATSLLIDSLIKEADENDTVTYNDMNKVINEIKDHAPELAEAKRNELAEKIEKLVEDIAMNDEMGHSYKTKRVTRLAVAAGALGKDIVNDNYIVNSLLSGNRKPRYPVSSSSEDDGAGDGMRPPPDKVLFSGHSAKNDAELEKLLAETKKSPLPDITPMQLAQIHDLEAELAHHKQQGDKEDFRRVAQQILQLRGVAPAAASKASSNEDSDAELAQDMADYKQALAFSLRAKKLHGTAQKSAQTMIMWYNKHLAAGDTEKAELQAEKIEQKLQDGEADAVSNKTKNKRKKGKRRKKAKKDKKDNKPMQGSEEAKQGSEEAKQEGKGQPVVDIKETRPSPMSYAKRLLGGKKRPKSKKALKKELVDFLKSIYAEK